MNITGGHTSKLILIPFSWLYGLVVRIRNGLYDKGFLKSSGFELPLISVGNITVGGTGKTPHVEYLVELLRGQFRVATLSRGYKRKTKDFRIASVDSKVRDIGDEPLQIHRHYPEITVAVDRRRVHGVEMLRKQQPPPEVVLLDDAYQHRSVKAGLSILLIDYARPLDRDRLLPAGMLREPVSGRNRADIILVTRSPGKITPAEVAAYENRLQPSKGQHLYFTTMRYGELQPVYPETPEKDLAWFREGGGGVLMVTGIANPGPLREFAQSISTNLTGLTFPDHHDFTRKDVAKISRTWKKLKQVHGEILVLTTEKDATRLQDHDCEPELRDAMHAVRIHVHFLNDDKDKFDRQILNYVKSSKRSRILYQGKDS